MKNDKYRIFAWLITAAVVFAGMCITKSAWCIWGMAIPAIWII